MTVRQTIDEAKLEAFVGKGVNDFGTMLTAALVVIGDKLGLYKAMAGAGALTSIELAQRTGTTERYVRDWLVNQAASGYVDYDPASGRYTLPAEHAIVLTDENSPFFLIGAFQGSLAAVKSEPKILEAMRNGGGLLWGDQDPDLFVGTERLFRPGYNTNLVANWIPALDGVEAKLKAGATVADVGCGHAASTIIMGQAYPRSSFVGYDNHAPSIERAREAAADAGIADRVTFEVVAATEYPSAGYDLIAFFDCLHDMGYPLAALQHARETIAPDGTVLLVEPMAGKRVEDNFNPVGRAYSGFSVLVCMPNALASCNCDSALGTIATDDQLREVASTAGFTRFRRATETPFNRVFEIRP